MDFTLIIGSKNYSSWSMRAWTLLKQMQVPFKEETVPLYAPGGRETVRSLGGQSGLVPVLKHGDLAIWDTLAIVEYVNESVAAVWPAPPKARARARSISAEMHAGMTAMRAAMPVNTRARNRIAEITPAATADIGRAIEIWETALSEFGGPWLMGDFSAADIMFAPVATRFRTYGVALRGAAKGYQERILAHPVIAEWLELGECDPTLMPQFERPERRVCFGASRHRRRNARTTTMNDKVNLREKLASFAERWTPHIVASINGHDVMVVKVKDEFVWHKHEDTDDFFLVLKGALDIELRDRTVQLREGELFVVPKGVEHRPVARYGEAEVLLIEPAGTPNTGDAATAVEKKRI